MPWSQRFLFSDSQSVLSREAAQFVTSLEVSFALVENGVNANFLFAFVKCKMPPILTPSISEICQAPRKLSYSKDLVFSLLSVMLIPIQFGSVLIFKFICVHAFRALVKLGTVDTVYFKVRTASDTQAFYGA